MTTYRYTREAGANEAKAVGVAIPVSFKQSYNLANHLRGKSVAMAKKIMEDAIAMRAPIPLTKYNKETGHKHGMAAGRYLVSTCTEILKLLKSAESNAQFKGLSAANLVVKHIAAQDGPRTPRYGRQGRRKSKRAHVEIILSEGKPVQKAKVEKKAPATAAPAPEKKTAPAKIVAAAPKQEAKKQ